MTLSERLRAMQVVFHRDAEVRNEAADELDKKDQRIAELEAALSAIAGKYQHSSLGMIYAEAPEPESTRIAAEALNEGKK